ncbi:aminotransferase class I/II-fold pyridoxal phosphate-dependent enzyme, partial [Candidatus Woesearchaeota archaeon]|nr:aminotransferase class I/II-fold pyridoxal phosphate-dependent enzyme [Candidatus Woesearchaeota archaeon]
YSSTKAILEDEGNGRNAIGTYPGITVDLNVPGALEAAIKEQKSKGKEVLGVIFEPIANPSIEYTDTREVAKVAHRYNVPVIVDNTFLTPYLQEPFRMGADMVVHSLTKYFSGKGDMTGGVVIAPKELIPGVQNVRKNQGGIMSIRDAQEFGSRAGYVASVVEEASENAKELAHALRSVDGVSVNYVEEDFSETRYGLGGGVLSFVFDGEGDVPYKRGRKFDQYLIGNPHTIKHRVSLAEPHTLSITWAGQLSPDAIQKWGVKPGLVRVACGTESDYSQVIDHIKRGIEKSL